MNLILQGNYGDTSRIHMNFDYYMAHSDGDGFTLWHSRDIISREPVIKRKFKGAYTMIWVIDPGFLQTTVKISHSSAAKTVKHGRLLEKE